MAHAARGVRGVDERRGVLRAGVAALVGGHPGQRDGLVVEVSHHVRLAVGVVGVAAVSRGIVVGAVEVLLGLEDGRDPGVMLDVGAVLAGTHHGECGCRRHAQLHSQGSERRV